MRVARFFREVYWDNRIRGADARRNLPRDLLLYARNRALQPLERVLERRYRDPDPPVVFIVGAPRSGTTLLYQLLARFLEVGYGSNRMARYWLVPVVGAVRHGPLRREEISLNSRFGASVGPMGPHEFSWFWQFHTGFRNHDQYDDETLAKMNWSGIRGALEGLVGYFQSPLMIKSINYVNYHVEFIARYLPQSRFLWIERNEEDTIRSILRVREERYGDASVWWSVRPHDVERWKSRSPEEQVVHQFTHVRDALARAASRLGNRFQRVTYEALVTNPKAVVQSVGSFIGVGTVDPSALSALRLTSRNRRDTPDDMSRRLARAKERVVGALHR